MFCRALGTWFDPFAVYKRYKLHFGLLGYDQFLPLAKTLLVVDKKDLFGDHAIELDLQKSFVKQAAGWIRKELNDLRVFARINRHRLGLSCNRVYQIDAAF